MKHLLLLAMTICLLGFSGTGQTKAKSSARAIKTGAEQTEKYIAQLQNKRVAILANPTSVIGKTHLVDSLLKRGIRIVKVFGPEHGFRGNASNGDKVGDEVDPATGIPVISLYGNGKNKPSAADLADVDVMIYDIQDMGCRFFTTINALVRLMESCAENNKELMILDRPNPNGHLIDGPVLDMQFKSGIGMFPIPVTHGMTVGEFAQMANGQGWLSNKLQCKLNIIKVANYTHDMLYTLPTGGASPNLNTQQSIMLYPSLCLFEGTIISQGRGTYIPFTVLGNPDLDSTVYPFHFTPVSLKGMSESPLHMNRVCYGLDLRQYDVSKLYKSKKINISWMIELYKAYPHKEKFFDSKQSKAMGVIEKLIGVADFRKQIMDGVSEEDIRKSWEPGLSAYKVMRKQYLLYP
ncbi:MAG: DUF1343 domain-containing protein [Chitinophagaceae bacterium]|nr:DUF1343 domain-containing protein [Chitinophagaceae bacterium]